MWFKLLVFDYMIETSEKDWIPAFEPVGKGIFCVSPHLNSSGAAHTAVSALWVKLHDFAVITHKSQKDVMCGRHPRVISKMVSLKTRCFSTSFFAGMTNYCHSGLDPESILFRL